MRADLQRLPRALFHADDIRRLEAELAAKLDFSLYEVMEEAGRQAYLCLNRRWPHARNVLVICGRGNNGGDGFVLGRLAMQAGMNVHLLQSEPARPLDGDAADAKAAWLAKGGSVEDIDPLDAWPDCDVIVDGLLGSGLSGTLSPAMAAAIDRMNEATAPILALDVPSGINGNTGAAQPIAVEANVTITFVGMKPALLTGAGAVHAGEIELAPLQIGQCSELKSSNILKSDIGDFRPDLSPRGLGNHKGDHGRLLLIGGDEGMAGAIRIAGEGALRAGAGLVSVLTRSENCSQVQSGRPELMVRGIENSNMKGLLHERLDWANVVAIGPGLGKQDWGRQLVKSTLEHDVPMVVDADGLNLLAEEPRHSSKWILTPHPGEAATLLGCTVAEVENDRFHAVAELQRKYGGIAVLKGRGTLICDDEKTYVAPVGNPGLATGGSGDLLTGIIAALLAQGLPPIRAACCGVCVHGEAADLAAEEGQRGMLATDLLPLVRRLVNPDSGGLRS